MSNEASNPTLTELLNRVDLSHLPQTEIIRLQAEAARAEYVAELVATLYGKFKTLIKGHKPSAIKASGLRHA